MSTEEIVVAGPAEVAGWQSAGDPGSDAGTLAVVQREKTEIESAIVVAHQFPRDEAAAYTRIMRSCDRPTFAEGARYSFPRGGATVTGPSVQLARELARCWGNIRYGLRIVSVDDDNVHVRGFALDLETNNYVEMEDRFARLVQRKRDGRTQWVTPDERDLRELVNRRGAICVRNAILQLLPPDIIEDAQRASQETIRKAAKGELRQDRQAAIRRLALAFDELGVTTAMLEDHLGHDLELLTEEELADLRGVYTSVREGNTKRSDHFDFKPRRDRGESDLNRRLGAAESVPDATVREEAPPPREEPETPVSDPQEQPEAAPDPALGAILAALDAASTMDEIRTIYVEDIEGLDKRTKLYREAYQAYEMRAAELEVEPAPVPEPTLTADLAADLAALRTAPDMEAVTAVASRVKTYADSDQWRTFYAAYMARRAEIYGR